MAGALAAAPTRAEWTLTPRGVLAVDPGTLSDLRELSGVTHLGPGAGGTQRFAAIQDEDRRVVFLDVAFSPNGAVTSALAVDDLTLPGGGPDYEGIAFTGVARGSLVVSEENTATLREFRMADGVALQSITLPAPFDTTRSNKGLESLTLTQDGAAFWTANQEALTADGPASTPTASTLVRLQRVERQAGGLTLGAQHVYPVAPIHAPGSGGQNGLVDLVTLPDGSLLALERSAAPTSPPLLSRLYHVTTTGATDTRGAPFATGLVGKAYTPVTKTLLWSGTLGPPLNSNLEGLTLGPALPNGNWVVLGVLDNSNDGDNLVASFELSLGGNAAAGDFNRDGAVNEADYTLWAATYGSPHPAADANADGHVNAADYVVWRDAAATPTSATPAPAPAGAVLLGVGATAPGSRWAARRRAATPVPPTGG